jgi:hypothetical protein|tara:strand:- start:45 stop:488 length:444 start_codon:yes stop_codon:yes gene_type:complete
MAEEKENFQLNKKWLGKGHIISCITNQDGYMIALAYDHDKVVEYNSRWLEKEESSWTEEGIFSKPSETPLPPWVILETKKIDHFIINEAWLGRRLLLTYQTKEGKMQSYNHDKYHLNHKNLITNQKTWDATKIFSDPTKGPIPKLNK